MAYALIISHFAWWPGAYDHSKRLLGARPRRRSRRTAGSQEEGKEEERHAKRKGAGIHWLGTKNRQEACYDEKQPGKGENDLRNLRCHRELLEKRPGA